VLVDVLFVVVVLVVDVDEESEFDSEVLFVVVELVLVLCELLETWLDGFSCGENAWLDELNGL